MTTGNDFLMIVPPEFTEIQDATRIIAAFAGEGSVVEALVRQDWNVIDQMMDFAGMLVPGTGVHDARLFRTDDGPNPLRLFVRWGPEL